MFLWADVRRVWDAVTLEISKDKMSVATYLHDGAPFSVDDSKLVIAFPEDCSFQKESLESEENLRLVEDIVFGKINKRLRVEYQFVEKLEPQEEVEDVKDVLDTFGGEVVSRWHEE